MEDRFGLRDIFAIAFLQVCERAGMPKFKSLRDERLASRDRVVLAEECYLFADAMMRVRSRGSVNPDE